MVPPPSALGLPQPRPHATPPVEGDSYARIYTITGPPGTYALQQVTTAIRYLCGEHAVATYAGTYTEFFRFAEDGSLGHLTDGRPFHDVHDLDLRRDGWCPQGLRKLIRSHRVRDAEGALCARAGEASLTCDKRYLLVPAEVEDVRPAWQTRDGGAFGYLAEGPGAAPAPTLTLACCRGGAPQTIPLSSPTPSAHPLAGRGRFTATCGWQARERYTYTFALQRGTLDDAGYVEVPVPEATQEA